jgi:hypothetical protein
MPASLMIGHHFSASAFCKAPSASGVCCSRGKILHAVERDVGVVEIDHFAIGKDDLEKTIAEQVSFVVADRFAVP